MEPQTGLVVPKQKIRVESVDSESGARSQVFLVREDGEEVDISKITHGVDIQIRVGEVNKATCYMYYPYGRFDAELEEVVLDVIPVERIPEVIRKLMVKINSVEETNNV